MSSLFILNLDTEEHYGSPLAICLAPVNEKADKQCGVEKISFPVLSSLVLVVSLQR